MRVDQNTSRTPFVLTDDRISHLNAISAAGDSMSAAAKELGVDPKTIKKAARQQGFEQWLKDKFPPRHQYKGGGHNMPKCTGEMHWLEADEIDTPLEVDTGLLHVRAAIMRWRVAG
jgi:hypothetical protein